jgi:alpha-tubulin suppressor-like RCC1 family protein
MPISSQASTGLTFTLLLTDSGLIYACGSCENGQLGNDKDGACVALGSVIRLPLLRQPTALD